MISHLWTGDHEYEMTTAQFIMHNVSMIGCALIFLYFQNRAVRKLFGFTLWSHWWLYLTVPLILFWLAFFLKLVPLDVLLWLVSVGFLNGIFMVQKLVVTRWVLWSTLSSLIGFIAAAVVLFPLDPYLTSLDGLTAHIVMFTLLGIATGVPMATIGGFFLQRNFQGMVTTPGSLV